MNPAAQIATPAPTPPPPTCQTGGPAPQARPPPPAPLKTTTNTRFKPKITTPYTPATTPALPTTPFPIMPTPPPVQTSPIASDNALSPPPTRTPFKPSAPVAIPPTPHPRPTLQLTLPETTPLPEAIADISPSYPATLFGGLSPDDEHVTVWEPTSGKTVAGNAAPYRRNLSAWLAAHPGWEEKADELKSSKRRSAARRSRIAAQAFAAVCCYPVASALATDAAAHLLAIGSQVDLSSEGAMAQWTVDDFVRLQECLNRLAQSVHQSPTKHTVCEDNRWQKITHELGVGKLVATVVYCAHHMLTRGIAKSLRELSDVVNLSDGFGTLVEYALPPSSRIGSPASLEMPAGSGGLSPVGLGHAVSSPGAAAVLERSFRAPREPRVTVWNPENGRTISGNAAPCRRNLEAWMKQHPGWLPKEEGQLSSSRRNRNRKSRPSASGPLSAAIPVPPPAEPESPHFHDALEGLLVLARSPCAGELMASRPDGLVASARLEDEALGRSAPVSFSEEGGRRDVAMVDGEHDGIGNTEGFVPTSSVSCSSVDEDCSMSDGVEVDDDVDDDVQEEQEEDGSDMEL